MVPKHQLRKLQSQLTIAFLTAFLGFGAAVGLPIRLLIDRQVSSEAQLLLNQAIVASRAFMDGERSDLESLALLVSQRPTLKQLLEVQDFSSLEDYLSTLRESANLDLIWICSSGKMVAGVGRSITGNELCQLDSQSGYVALSSDTILHLYARGSVSSDQQPLYTVGIAKNVSSILAELQQETGLLYILIWQDQAAGSSDPSVEITPSLGLGLLRRPAASTNRSLQQRSFRIDEHQYIVSNLELDQSLQLQLASALNVDSQIAIQQSLSSTLAFGLFFIVLVASVLGIWFSQRISRPIVNLASAAAEFRQGNVDTPIAIQSPIWEVDQLANTLEDGRVALQHSLQQLRAEKVWIEHLLNSIVEGILTLDNENRITFASAGVSTITREALDQLIGQRIDDIFSPLEGELNFSDQLPALGQQRRISVRLKKDQERLLSISKSKLIPPEASSSNHALVIRDVSNEEYIHRLLGDFMANITHEFRTPLAALEASSELLLDNLSGLSQAEIEELLVALNLGISDLQTLIDNLIEAASMEAGRFKILPQAVSFDAILRDALGIIQPLAKKYSLRLVSSPVAAPILVMADQRRTVQVLINLLSNAVKHSPENGSVQIKHRIIDRKLRVEVIDEGRGVPPAQRSQLFRRFAHLDTANERARQGAGLGLSVVKEIVEAQQGEVGITELPEGGTSFWFTLPLINGSTEE